MTNDGICVIFVFLEEIICSRECNLIDILFDFFCSQTNTAIGNGNSIFA